MSDAGAGRLALVDVTLRFADDGAAIAPVLGLRRDRLRGIPEHFRGDRLGLCEGIAARRIDSTPPIRRGLLRVDIDGTTARFVTRSVFRGLARRSRMFVR